MAGKPTEPDLSFMDKIPLSYRDYPGDVEPSEPVEISVAHLDFLPTAPEPAAKSAKKEN